MAIDFPASPTNGQTFTSGSVTYTWDGTKWTAVAAAGSSNSISQGNTNATVTDTGSDGRFVVTTEGSERLRVDSSGRLGVGTASPNSTLEVSGTPTTSDSSRYNLLVADSSSYASGVGGGINFGYKFNSAGSFITRAASIGVRKENSTDGDYASSLTFHTAPGSGQTTEKARLDSSGRLLVGTSSVRTVSYWDTPQVQIEGLDYQKSSLCIYNNQDFIFGSVLELGHSRGTSIGSNAALQNNDYLGTIAFYGSDGSNEIRGAEISTFVDGTPGANDMPGRLVFSTTADGASSPTERMRISANGSSNFFNSSSTTFVFGSALAAGTSDNFMLGLSSRSTNTSGGSTEFVVRTNGNVLNTNNSYGSLSDAKLKENIVDANSQWDDIKALRPVNYNFKEGQTHTQIGLIAQEVELVSPGLVTESPDRDEDGNDLGTVTKSVNYSVLYMKAVKALQEAMERIETLEAKVAALESA